MPRRLRYDRRSQFGRDHRAVPDRPAPPSELTDAESYALIAEHTSDLVGLLDQRGHFIYAGLAYRRVLGYDPAALVGTDAFDLVHPDDLASVREQWSDTLAHGAAEATFRQRHADGSWRWVEARGNLVERHGTSYVVGVARDITERRRVEEELRESEERFRRLSEAAFEGIVINDQGQHIDTNAAFAALLGYEHDEVVSMHALDFLAPECHEFVMEQIRSGAEQPYEAVGRRKDGSTFPVEIRGKNIPYRGRKLRVTAVRDITDRKRVEMENARLYQEARQQAGRLEALAAASHAFAEASLDLQAVLDRVTQRVAELIGDFCAIRLVSDDGRWLVTVAQYHSDPEAHALVETVRALPYRVDEGFMGQVVQTGRTLRIPVVEDPRVGINPDLWPYLDRIGLHSLLMAPLRVRGRVIGAIGATRSTPGRPYTADDELFLQDLADRAALAIDHARLYAAERQAKELAERAADRAARLQTVTAALAATLMPAQVAKVVLRQGIAATGAYAGAIILRSASGETFEMLGETGYPPGLVDAWRSSPAGTPTPILDAGRSGEPVWIPSRDAAGSYPHLTAALAGRMEALAAIPLLAGARPIGALALSFDEPQPFNPDDRAFMLALGQQCTQAIERARLYEAEQRARAEAEAAVRLRDVFLSVASHELKTPLTSLMGQAQLLERRAVREGALGERDQRAVQVVAEQAARLNRMITALLDVSRIEQGQLSIERAPLDLGALARRVVAEVQPTLHKHTAACTGPDAPLPIEGDALRLEQVLQNLIQNAIKYSPAGGPVLVRLDRCGTIACVAVSDRGIGIPQEALPQLFQRFYRAANADERHISGMGVGLYVVKEIVALHGGTVEVASVEGQGSTFTICLPLAEPAALASRDAEARVP